MPVSRKHWLLKKLQMTKYSEHIKPKRDVVTWFSTLMIRIALTDDERERKELFSEVASITDEHAELREYAVKAGATGILPSTYKSMTMENPYER